MYVSPNDTARRFIEVVPHVMRIIAAEVRLAGLGVDPVHVHLLGLLLRGDMTLGDLADAFAVGRPTMSKTISTLESRGWVHRRRDDGDRRVVLVGVTDEGRELVLKARRHLVDRLADALGSLDDERRATLSRGIEALRDAFPTMATDDEANAPAGGDRRSATG
jgi:DNA-binding MarR family transcriptional regulator